MSSTKHALGVVAAGVLAFLGVFAASALFTPEPGETSTSSSSHSDSEQTAEPSEEPSSEQPTSADIVGRWQAPEPANQDAFVGSS